MQYAKAYIAQNWKLEMATRFQIWPPIICHRGHFGHHFSKWKKHTGQESQEKVKKLTDRSRKSQEIVQKLLKGQETFWTLNHFFYKTFVLNFVANIYGSLGLVKLQKKFRSQAHKILNLFTKFYILQLFFFTPITSLVYLPQTICHIL